MRGHMELQDNSPGPSVEQAVRSAQVVVGALVAGLIMFGVVVEAVLRAGAAQPGLGDVLLPVLGVLYLGAGGASVALPRIMLSRAMVQVGGLGPDEAARALAPAYLTSCILRGALLEGPGLFGLVIVMLTGNPLAYVAPALSVLMLVGTFPGRGRFDDLVERARGVRGDR